MSSPPIRIVRIVKRLIGTDVCGPLGHFRAQYPEVAINLQVFNSRQVERAVAERRYELGISLSHSRPDNLKVEEFGVDELVVVVGKRHRLPVRPR